MSKKNVSLQSSFDFVDHQLSFDLKARQAAEAKVLLEWQIGDVILDTYEVKEKYDGGMGVVYRVYHRNWDMDLAVKSPRIEFFQNETQRENFIRECETWINLGLHPHIVSCFYVRTLGGMPRIFAEFVDGGSLENWIQNGTLYEGGTEKALERILDIAIQMAWGLQYAHEQGLIHKDVKPQNVIMTLDGTAKITDFGIAVARAVAGKGLDPASNESVMVTGSGGYTRAYCSPEQFAKEPLTSRTDVWSWAVTVLEMFTGGVSWEIGTVVDEVLENLSEIVFDNSVIPSITVPILELLQECFSREPSQRPKMETIAHSLQQIFSFLFTNPYTRTGDKGIDLQADGLNNRALSLLDIGKPLDAINTWTKALEIYPNHPEATYNKGLYLWRCGKTTDEELLNKLMKIWKTNPQNEGMKALISQIHNERGDSNLVSFYFENNRRNFSNDDFIDIIGTSDAIQNKCIGITGGSNAYKYIDIDEGGNYAFTVSRDNSVCFWNIKNCSIEKEIMVCKNKQYLLSASFSKDWQFVLTLDEDLYANGFPQTVTLWNLLSPGNEIVIKNGKNHEFQLAALSPNGKKVFISGKKTNLLIDLSTMEQKWENNFLGEVISAVFSPKSHEILTGPFSLNIIDAETGKIKHKLSGHQRVIKSISVSKNGKLGLTGSIDQTIRLWDLENYRCLSVLEGHFGSVNSVAISPEGDYGLSGGDDGTIRFWDLKQNRCIITLNRDGRGGKEKINAVALNIENNFAISGSRSLIIWSMPSKFVPATYAISSPVSFFEAATKNLEREILINKIDSAIKNRNFREAYELTQKIRSLPGFQFDKDVFLYIEKIGLHGRKSGIGRNISQLFEFNHELDVTSAAISKNGDFAVIGCGSGSIYLWDLIKGEIIRLLNFHSDDVCHLSLLFDDTRILSGSWDSNICLWDIASGSILWKYSGKYVNCQDSISISKDNSKAFFATCDDQIDVIDLNSGKCLGNYYAKDSRSQCLAISNDELWGFSFGYDVWDGSNKNITIWDLKNNKIIKQNEVKEVIDRMKLTFDGTKLIVLTSGSGVQIWDSFTCNIINTLDGTYGCEEFILSNDDNYIIMGFADGKIQIYDLQNKKLICTFLAHNNRIVALALSRNEHICISGSRDYRAKVWRLDWEYEFQK